MIDAEFSVYTEVTGRNRRVDVEVYDTAEEMRTHGTDTADWDASGAHGMTITWSEQDPADEHFATIRFYRDALTPYVITHEATHAAMKIYSVDMLYGKNRVKSRATAHMNVHNETICYLVGEISHYIIQGIYEAGLEVVTRTDGNDEDDNEDDTRAAA
jgi:hypothetical protein